MLTLLGLQYRFGDKLLGIRLVCPRNGSAVLKVNPKTLFLFIGTEWQFWLTRGELYTQYRQNPSRVLQTWFVVRIPTNSVLFIGVKVTLLFSESFFILDEW